jgi:hypothetical protein
MAKPERRRGEGDAKVPGTDVKPGGRGKAGAGAAFDVWLERDLRRMFDAVAREPIPDDLLKLIENDRKR